MTKLSLSLRLAAAIAILVIALALAVQHLGVTVPGCSALCSRTQNLWFSGVFVLAMLASSVLIVVSLLRWDQAGYRRLAWLQGAAGAVAASISIEGKFFCPLCVVTQGVWIVMALEAAPWRWVRMAAVPCSVIALLAVMDIIDFSRPFGAPVGFVVRPYEGRVKGSPAAVVIFTDPLCPYCRADEQSFVTRAFPMPVLYRWKLLPQHGPAAVTLAALVESAKRRDYRAGSGLQAFIYSGQAAPSRVEIVGAAVRLGFSESQVNGWMQSPEPESLDLVAEDGLLASKLGIPQVPFVCTVSTVFAYRSGPQVSILRDRDLGPMSEVTGRDWSALRAYFEPGSMEVK